MRRTLVTLCIVAVASLWTACGGGENGNAGNSSATRNGIVDTNANVSRNLNANTAPSNVGVVTNDNGNKNTSGVTTINSNSKAGNGNSAGGNRNSNRP